MRWFARLLTATAAAVCLAAVSGCASHGPIGSGPAAFPGAPRAPWAETVDEGHAFAMRPLLETAIALEGARYVFGGTTPEVGFDCSGFVRYVFQQYSLNVPRTVAEQFRVGREVSGSHVSAGDLLFFSTVGPGATHVGIVVDPVARTFVHAPGSGAVVRVERFDTRYWRSRMLGVRRVPFQSANGS